MILDDELNKYYQRSPKAVTHFQPLSIVIDRNEDKFGALDIIWGMRKCLRLWSYGTGGDGTWFGLRNQF